MFLHKLGHIDTHHRLFTVEQEVGQRLTQLGLTDPGGAKKEEGTVGAVGVGQASTGTAHGIGHRGDRFALTDHPLVQLLFHAQQFFALALQHLRDRNTGPARHHFRHLFIGDLVAQQFHLHHLDLAGHIELLFQLGNDAVLQLGHLGQVTGAARRLQVHAGLFQVALDLLRTV